MRDQFFGAKKAKVKAASKHVKSATSSSQERVLKPQPDFADFKRMVDGFRALSDVLNGKM